MTHVKAFFYLAFLLCLPQYQAICAEPTPYRTAPSNTPKATSKILKTETTPIPITGPKTVQSALGFDVNVDITGSKTKPNYNSSTISGKPRIEALKANDMIMDAVDMSPYGQKVMHSFKITKDDKGIPAAKFEGVYEIISKTPMGGYVIKNNGKHMYYSGFVLTSPTWKALKPGLVLKDGHIVLTKAEDPKDEFPMYIQIFD